MAQEHLDKLALARDELVIQRRHNVASIAKGFQREHWGTWLDSLIKHQAAIEAVDRATEDEAKRVEVNVRVEFI